MPTFPSLSAGPDTVRQRRHLAAWLFEWQADRRLRAACGAGRAAAPATAKPIGSRRPLAPGRIVLLPPVPDAGPAERPLYVLVLETESDGALRAAPFGRFAVPAVPGEWRTGLRAGPLRVLCLWNARRFPRRLLEAGWQAGRLRRAPLARALALDRLGHEGGAGIWATAPDVGPPLRHPLDPRHDYAREEREALEAVLRLEPNPAGRFHSAQPAPAYRLRPGPISKAAKPPPPDYGV